MLVLGRKAGEAIKIGDNITIHILHQRGQHVRIGIDAPADIPVHREEIYQRIQQEQNSPAEAAEQVR